VLLVGTAPSEEATRLYFLRPSQGKPPGKIYSIRTQRELPSGNVKESKLTAQAVGGCDTTSCFFGKGKIKALKILCKPEFENVRRTFCRHNSRAQDIFREGVEYIKAIYQCNEMEPSVTPNRLRYGYRIFAAEVRNVRKNVNLASLPPTDDAAQFHPFRCYYQVQTWLRNELEPTEWGWKRNGGGSSSPIAMTHAPAPQKLYCNQYFVMALKVEKVLVVARKLGKYSQ